MTHADERLALRLALRRVCEAVDNHYDVDVTHGESGPMEAGNLPDDIVSAAYSGLDLLKKLDNEDIKEAANA